MDVDGTRIDIGIMRPDRVEQPFAREDAARMFEEMAEQANSVGPSGIGSPPRLTRCAVTSISRSA
jgi:hypothetical protein